MERLFGQGNKKECTIFKLQVQNQFWPDELTLEKLKPRNRSHRTTLRKVLVRWSLPPTKHDDWTVCGFQLLFQLSDHDTIVSEGLLHCQQADLRNTEGVFAKWQRFAIISL